MRRLQYLPCAIDLIQQSRQKPSIKENPNNKKEILYRFFGRTKSGEYFCVQIKEQINQTHKYLMSVFPRDKKFFV